MGQKSLSLVQMKCVPKYIELVWVVYCCALKIVSVVDIVTSMEEGRILWDKRRVEESLSLWFRLESESHGFCRGDLEREALTVEEFDLVVACSVY